MVSFPYTDEYAEAVVPVVDAVGEDLSWRVRSKFAKSMDKLCQSSGLVNSSQFLLPAYVKLLKGASAKKTTRRTDFGAWQCLSCESNMEWELGVS
jgi:hypothetical protein